MIMLSAIVTNGSPVTLREVTPIARLTGEYEVIVAPAASPFRSLKDLIEAFKERPESISWGGGSAGGTDQILAGLFADALGVAPRRVNYIAFSGGGEAMSAILGGQVSVGINGLAEFLPQIEAGTVRVLALSSAERLPNLAAPTLREWVSTSNSKMGAASRRRSAQATSHVFRNDRSDGALRRMARGLERHRWIDRYLAGDEFDRFMEAEDTRCVPS